MGERRLGSTAGVVRQLYSYTTAENFRLVTLKAGNASPYTNLQNITYTYDDNGKVQTITDAAAYGGSQTQTFTDDALNRLLTAQAVGGSNGAYAQRSYVYSNAGNITSFEAAALTYTDASHKHAVTHVGSVQKYWYDANGNATRRIAGSQDIMLAYDTENRLTGMSGGATASYIYDGDGTCVKETSGGVTTIYIGAYFEWTGSTSTMKSYYYAGGTRVAMRIGTSTGTVNYLLGDHLGSQALTLTSAGARLNTNTELRYMPYGAARYTAGTTPTSFNFTGQRKDGGSGLLFYNARWYDPAIGRFLAADTIVPEPGNPQSLNRYSYVLNNALKYFDPSGHANECAIQIDSGCDLGPILPTQLVDAPPDALDNVAAVTEVVVSVLFEPADWIITGRDILEGKGSPWMLLGLLPFVPSSVGKYGDEAFDGVRKASAYLKAEGVPRSSRSRFWSPLTWGPFMYGLREQRSLACAIMTR